MTWTVVCPCQPTATDGVAWSVCVSVCWSRSWALQKRMKGSRCRLVADSGGPKEPCVRWGSRSPEGKGQFLGLTGPLKNIVSHRCGVRSKTNDNGISATAAEDCVVPHWPLTFLREKSTPLRCGLSSKLLSVYLSFQPSMTWTVACRRCACSWRCCLPWTATRSGTCWRSSAASVNTATINWTTPDRQ